MQINTSLLEQLNDIQLPDPVGWWPLAFSWWILIFSIIAIVAGAIWYYLDQKRRNIYRRSAVQQVEEILQQTGSTENVKISAINAVLKRVAVTAYGRLITASLHDQAWLDFLSETASYIPQPENLQDVLNLAYKPSQEEKTDYTDSHIASNKALEVWQDYAIKWIKGHHQ